MKKNKKKLLIVTDYFYPHWTGLSKSLYYLVQGISTELDVTVLTVKHAENLQKEENIHGVKVIRETSLFSFSRAKISIDLIKKYIFLLTFSEVLLINSPSVHILLLVLIGVVFNKKVLIFHQGDLNLPKGLKSYFIEKVYDFLTFFSFFLADKLATYTDDYVKNSRSLKSFSHKCFTFIPPLYIGLENKQKTKSKYSSKILVGFAGRFVEEKGFDILFDALPFLGKSLENIHFIFAGETHMNYEKFYEKNLSKIDRYNNAVSFLGLLDEDELLSFYASIDFIVTPSRSDCFNLVQAEAMLMRKPSIVANVPGVRYLVQKTKFGYIFDGGPKDLALKIETLIRNRKTIEKNYKKVTEILDNTKNTNKALHFIIS